MIIKSSMLVSVSVQVSVNVIKQGVMLLLCSMVSVKLLKFARILLMLKLISDKRIKRIKHPGGTNTPSGLIYTTTNHQIQYKNKNIIRIKQNRAQP